MRRRINWEQVILDALAERQPPATLCPSEVARREAGHEWRIRMPEIRTAAIALAKQRLIVISQGGVAIADPGSIRGPIRLGHPPQTAGQAHPNGDFERIETEDRDGAGIHRRSIRSGAVRTRGS